MESNYVERQYGFIQGMQNVIKEEELILESSAAQIRLLEERMDISRKSAELARAEIRNAEASIQEYTLLKHTELKKVQEIPDGKYHLTSVWPNDPGLYVRIVNGIGNLITKEDYERGS